MEPNTQTQTSTPIFSAPTVVPPSSRSRVIIFSLLFFFILLISGGVYYYFKPTAKKLIENNSTPLSVEEKIGIVAFHDPVNKLSIAYPENWELIQTPDGFSINRLLITSNVDGRAVNVKLFFYIANSIAERLNGFNGTVGGVPTRTSFETDCIETSKGAMECNLMVEQMFDSVDDIYDTKNKNKHIITVGSGVIKQFSPSQTSNPNHAADQEELEKLSQKYYDEISSIRISLNLDTH